jgi:hypothetical protein
LVDFELFDSWAIEISTDCYDAGFLARARGTIDEEAREVG